MSKLGKPTKEKKIKEKKEEIKRIERYEKEYGKSEEAKDMKGK